jgi:tetratricopeptide (TPR) repeat protein
LSVLLTHLKRFAEAEPYIKSTELNPNSDATLYNYGIIRKSLNRPAEALERLSHALSILRPQVSVSLIKQEEPKRTCQPFRAKASASVLTGGRLAAGQLAYIDELASPKMQMG